MSDTETTHQRRTPEELAEYWGGKSLLATLPQYGYRIVHPDDVPTGDGTDWPADIDPRWNLDRASYGWNLCREFIFGGDDE